MEPNLPLRDIHLPAPIGWWPPAPGWWLLLFGVPLLLGLLFWLWRYVRRRTVKKLALAELESIVQSDVGARTKVQQLAILLRRIALSVYPREQVASLVGEEWLAFLDRPTGGKSFSEGAGRLFIDAPYRREVQTDLDELFALCRAWIKHHPKPGKASALLSQKKDSKHLLEPEHEAVEVQDATPSVSDPRRFARPPADDGATP